MEEVSRRDVLAGSVLAGAAALAVAAHPAFADTAEDHDPFAEVEAACFDYGVDKETPGIKHAPEPGADVEKSVVIINASATIGGNGDTMAQTIQDDLGDSVKVTRFDLRNYVIAPVTQHGDVPPVSDVTNMDRDAMTDLVIPAIHEATALVFLFPTIYNTIDARTLALIGRLWQPTWSNPDWELGYQKRVAVIGTCTGSSPEWLTLNVNALLTLPDVLQSVADSRIDIFPGCSSPDSVANDDEKLAVVHDVAEWVVA